ncbi:MAG: glycosyltransferase family 4 protein [Candidatus Riflebacteria bacterium]|nr:glycosyltransferase family 4 protein [Candidatus Riflebacteria bacterium]
MLRGNDFDLSVFTPNKRAMLLDAINASDAASVLSSEARDKLEQLFPLANVVKVCNGISCENWFLDTSDLAAAAAFKAENLKLGRTTIGVIGQIKEKKGVVFLLENMLKSGFNEKFSLIIVGDVEQGVSEWIKEREEFFDIVFLPFMDRFELLRIYPACDFVALPSHYDGMPNVLLEAGALGIPLIAAQTGGIAEVLPAAQAALTFFPGNALRCIEALAVAAAMSKEDRERVGQILKKHICEEFSAETEIKGYCELFKSI